ncbi:MAG: hypothetical protein U0361_25275 [Nitrospiraceae bacterium]
MMQRKAASGKGQKPEESKYVNSVVQIPVRAASDYPSSVAKVLTKPEVCAAAIIESWQANTYDVNALAAELRRQTESVNGGDMSRAEGMLLSQAHALEAIFVNLARRATKQEYVRQWETYMRIALKAQSQCRATLEALSEIKHPRSVAFIQQANLTSGPQQVNNGTDSATSTRTGAGAHAQAGKSGFPQTQLSGSMPDHARGIQGRQLLVEGAISPDLVRQTASSCELSEKAGPMES